MDDKRGLGKKVKYQEECQKGKDLEKDTVAYQRKGLIWLDMVGHSTTINFMGEVMPT